MSYRTALLSMLAVAGTQVSLGNIAASGPVDSARPTEIRRNTGRLQLAGLHPAVREGIEVICEQGQLVLTPGTAIIDGKPVRTRGGEVIIPPTETVEISELQLTLVADPVQSWHGGNRLIISRQDRRNLLPGSYMADSLSLRDPARPDEKLAAGRDFVVDNIWGAFSTAQGGRLKAGDKITATYRMSLRRVDALVLQSSGRPWLIHGEPSPDCPLPPKPPDGSLLLANVYRPFNSTVIEPHHLYVPVRQHPDMPPVENLATLDPVLAKLRAGQPVTVVCWGDSVTAGGEASSPGKMYVGLFETLLKQRFPKSAIKVVNAGIGGTSTPGRWPGFQKEVLDFKPDVVTLEFINDAGIPVPDLQKRYDEILAAVRKSGSVLLLITPHFSMPGWMNLPNGRGPDPRPLVAFLRRFARENRVPLADAARRWEQLEQVGVPYETLLRNGINHPDDRGHRIFAEELMRCFP